MIAPRSFGLQVGAMLGLLAVFPVFWGDGPRMVLLAPATLLVGAALVMPSSLGLLSRGWMALSRLMERLASPIVMRVLYYGLIVPFAPTVPSEDRAGWQPPDSWSEPLIPSTAEAGLMAEVWRLLRDRQRLVLVPLLVVLLILGGLFLLVEGTALLPFVYPLF